MVKGLFRNTTVCNFALRESIFYIMSIFWRYQFVCSQNCGFTLLVQTAYFFIACVHACVTFVPMRRRTARIGTYLKGRDKITSVVFNFVSRLRKIRPNCRTHFLQSRYTILTISTGHGQIYCICKKKGLAKCVIIYLVRLVNIYSIIHTHAYAVP